MSFFHLQKSQFMQFCNSMREPISFLSAVKEARNNISSFHLCPWQQRRSKSELEENRVYFLQRAIVRKTKKTKNKTVVSWQNVVSTVAQCKCIGAHHTVATHIRWLPRHQKKACSCYQLPQLSIKEMDWLIQRTFQFCSLLNTSGVFFPAGFSSLIILRLPLNCCLWRTFLCAVVSHVRWIWTSQTKYNLPSWCDRILRKSYPLAHVVSHAYGEWFPEGRTFPDLRMETAESRLQSSYPTLYTWCK